MTAPAAPAFSPADAWEALVRKGVPKADATKHVLRQIANQPEAVQAQYLKDVDPGKLASFGLGAADMMSFGLGDQVARKLLGETARMTQTQAQAQHPTAHTLGEVAGFVGPAAAEIGLTKAGKLAPSAIRASVNAIKSRAGRIAAKAALNAIEGATLAGAQAAGRTEGGVGERAKAAAQAAPYGAAAGVAVPAVLSAIPTAINRAVVRPTKYATNAINEVLDRYAGKAVPRPVSLDFDLLPAGRAPTTNTPPVTARPLPLIESGGPLDVPTYQRRGLLEPPSPTPLQLTEAEQATNAAAKALRARARDAARNAYNLAISAGQSLEQAKAAAQRAAATVGLLRQ